MIIGIGVDIVEIRRVEEVLTRRGDRFLARVFTSAEVTYCQSLGSPWASYAARFAAKEAMMKALGTGWTGGIAFREIEVVRADGGVPSIRLYATALSRFEAIGATRVHLSLSHSREFAIAQVLLEG
jgi:holo-[acyl-carrier protein] synthase